MEARGILCFLFILYKYLVFVIKTSRMGNKFGSYVNCMRLCFDGANCLVLMEDIVVK